MTYGETCRLYGGRILRSSGSEHKMESLDEYHRITRLLPGGSRSIQTVKYSGTSWIAIRVEELIFAVTHSISQEKPEKLDLFKISHSPCHKVVAVVSTILVNGESQDGSGIAASFAEFNEKAASSFLIKKLKKGSKFKFEEIVQITISAFCHLFPGNIKANEIQFSVMTNDQQFALPIEAIEALLENKNNNFCSVLSLPVISNLRQQMNRVGICCKTVFENTLRQDDDILLEFSKSIKLRSFNILN